MCDFNSIHSRNLIKGVRDLDSYSITVLSSYKAPAMDGIKMLTLNQGGFGDKSGLQSIASLILKLSPSIYRVIVTFFLSRRTKKSISRLKSIKLTESPDVIHALRTQPEGIIACHIHKRTRSKFVLTTWGQDFILWSKLDVWLSSKTKEVLNNLDTVLPDNFRDDKIIRKISKNSKLRSQVLPATGGLDFDFMQSYNTQSLAGISPKYSFLTTRGYENGYVKLKKVILVFKHIVKRYPESQLYIDLHSRVDEEKDKELMDYITANDLQSSVTLLHLSREEMFTYMSKCRYHVSVTYSDGMPLSLLESLYFGQTPIVFDHESTRILEQQFEHYHSFSSYNIGAIEKSWLSALGSEYVLQENIANQNRIMLEQYYSRSKNIHEVVKHYE